MERSTLATDPVNMPARTMLCPRCRREQPLGDFEMLGMSPLYASRLVPVYRCGACSRSFALRPDQLGAA